jgi:type I restriction enzyme S subunit
VKQGWTEVALGDVCQIVSGATPKTKVADYWDGDIPWVTPKDLSDLAGAKLITATARTITDSGLRSCAATVLPAGSVLLSSRAPIGLVAINTVPMATNQGFKSLVPSARLDASYLYWWLRTHRRALEARGRGATFKEISRAVTAEVELPLPPLEEQQRIAAILDQADDLLAKRLGTIAHLDSLTLAVFTAMFGDPIRNEVACRTELLKDVTSKIGSGSTPRGGRAAYHDCGTPLIRSMNVHDGRFVEEKMAFLDRSQADALRNVEVRKGDVLVNITGASVARVCQLPHEMAGARVNQHVAIVRPTSEIHPTLLAAQLRHPTFKRTLLQMAGAGATREAITKDQLEQLVVLVPPAQQQERFDEACVRQGVAFRQALSAADTLEKLRDSLQARAFRGEL